MLTTAVNELAVQHLVAGMSRFAGASAVLLKLVFGTAAGLEIATVLGFPQQVAQAQALSEPWAWLAVAVASLNFALLFKADWRDYPLVMASAAAGFAVARLLGFNYGAEFAAFGAGLFVGVLSNVFARISNRPGAIVRVPGIIMLVPGSTGFRSLFLAIQGEVSQGLDVAFALPFTPSPRTDRQASGRASRATPMRSVKFRFGSGSFSFASSTGGDGTFMSSRTGRNSGLW